MVPLGRFGTPDEIAKAVVFLACDESSYVTGETDGWHVVTTIDIVFERGGDAEQHAVARFSATLLPGQWN